MIGSSHENFVRGRAALFACFVVLGCADDDAEPADGDTEGSDTEAPTTDTDTAAGTDTDDPAPLTTWTEHPCTFAIPNGLGPSDFRCGTFTVPQSWESPNGTTFDMEVGILLATGPSPAADPLVFFGGGPGVHNLEGYLPAQANAVLAPIAESRDIVFFDKRGVGLSQPNLACPELDAEALERFSVPTFATGLAEGFVQGYQQCHSRLVGEGIDPSRFNSFEVGNDVAALMEALGYATYNVYGISYGAMEAQILLRDHPEAIRSVILDGPVLPEGTSSAEWPAMFARSLDVLAQECAADTDGCGQSYPDLIQSMSDAVTILNETPHVASVSDPDGNPIDLHITGDRFAIGIHSALYRADLIPLLPAAIGGAAAGQTALIDAFAPSLAAFGGSTEGYYASVLCAEDIPFVTQEAIDMARAGLDPVITGPLHETNGGYFFAMCDAWAVPPRPAIDDEPVISDVPALVLSGQYDPATPPANGDRVAGNLANSTHVLFNGLGHGVLRSDTPPAPDTPTCAMTLVTAFLADPGAPVDGACAAARPGPFD